MAEYANPWQSGQVESLVNLVGSTPTSASLIADLGLRIERTTRSRGFNPQSEIRNSPVPWSSGQDAWATSRRPMVRIHPGSIDCGMWISVADLDVDRQSRRKSAIRNPQSEIHAGLMVQREDTSSADWESGFDPRWVHSKVM